MTREETVATESVHILITSYQAFLHAEQKKSLTVNIALVEKLLVSLWEAVQIASHSLSWWLLRIAFKENLAVPYKIVVSSSQVISRSLKSQIFFERRGLAWHCFFVAAQPSSRLYSKLWIADSDQDSPFSLKLDQPCVHTVLSSVFSLVPEAINAQRVMSNLRKMRPLLASDGSNWPGSCGFKLLVINGGPLCKWGYASHETGVSLHCLVLMWLWCQIPAEQVVGHKVS